VPELGSLGTVRGALGNERPYREHTTDRSLPGNSGLAQTGEISGFE
jgi:hypothetical protein